MYKIENEEDSYTPTDEELYDCANAYLINRFKLVKDDYTELIDYFNLFEQLCGATDFDQFAYEYFQDKGLIK